MYRFGPFEFDLRSHELRRDDARLKIPEQCFTVLRKLVEHPGELVTRDELRKAVWPAETFVDFDTGLNKIVKLLRQVLGDSADAPSYIETVPKLGYRFVAPLLVVEHPREATSEPPPPSFDGGASSPSLRSRWISIALVATACAAAIFLLAYKHSAISRAHSEIVRLSSIAGLQDDPDFSPDGAQVAFGVFDAGENSGIHTSLIGEGHSLQLTKNHDDCCPRWSPDGKLIALSRQTNRQFSILIVSALGGTPRKVYDSGEEPYRDVVGEPSYVSWSRDGKQLALSVMSHDVGARAIAFLTLADSSLHFVTKPPPGYSDWSPVISPDGRLLVFRRTAGPGFVDDLYVMPTQGGEPHRVTSDHVYIANAPAWTPDSKEVIFTSDRGGMNTLWRVSISGGFSGDEPRRIEGVGTGTFTPAVALKGHRLAYTQGIANSNLWSVTLADKTHLRGNPRQLMFSKGQVGLPAFSPDGARIVFESSRSGYNEIWLANSDGSEPAQLTFLNGEAGTPHWSYDNRCVAFDYRPKEHSEIYVADVTGGPPREIVTNPGSDNVVPNWSRDGKSLYFASTRGEGTTQIWKIAYPGGPPVQLTSGGGTGPTESADGFVYFTRAMGSDEIWKVPSQGGAETLVVRGNGLNCWCDWTLAANGIYFVSRSPTRSLAYYDFKTRTVTKLLDAANHIFNPSISPGGKTLVYGQTDLVDQTIVVVNNFH
jgi:Tol biopolymer transport system component/DNA-binding winged helix-turn-helix (wHTH) protein